MNYEENQLNPFVVAILQVLKAADKPLAIHELLQAIKAIRSLPVLDDDEQLALFKLNWLMMNALYQLQAALINDGLYLHIETLKIMLLPLKQMELETTEQALQSQPLRDFYWNWANFSNTTAEEVQAMLDGVWQSYVSSDQQSQACAVLGIHNASSLAVVKKAYRQQAAVHHPDKGGDAQQFMAVREAYECLKQCLQH